MKSEVMEFLSTIDEKREVRTGNSHDAMKLMRIVDDIYAFKKRAVHG